MSTEQSQRYCRNRLRGEQWRRFPSHHFSFPCIFNTQYSAQAQGQPQKWLYKKQLVCSRTQYSTGTRAQGPVWWQKTPCLHAHQAGSRALLCLQSQNKNTDSPTYTLWAPCNTSRAALTGQHFMRQNSKLLLVMRIQESIHYMQDSNTVHVG